jgi:zinc protease
VLTKLRESARTNGYWLGNVLAGAQEFPVKLDWSRTRYTDNESITAAELSALAKQYLDPAKAHEFIVLPAVNPAKGPAAK